MMKPSRITQREIDLAAQRADIYGLLAIPQPPRRNPRGPLYATLAVVVLALAGMLSLRFASAMTATRAFRSTDERMLLQARRRRCATRFLWRAFRPGLVQGQAHRNLVEEVAQ